jgi:hypothetical protein
LGIRNTSAAWAARATKGDDACSASTGLKPCGAGEWPVDKHGAKTRRSWRKRHIGMDADTSEIVASALTTNDVDDASKSVRCADEQPRRGVCADRPFLAPACASWVKA